MTVLPSPHQTEPDAFDLDLCVVPADAPQESAADDPRTGTSTTGYCVCGM